MCDYSLQNVASRPATVGDKLTTKHFGTGTVGFVGPQDDKTAVCVLPGTEIAFDEPFKTNASWLSTKKYTKVAVFRQINRDRPQVHHDALETPDGDIVLLTHLAEGQTATVLQLPAPPKSVAEAAEQKRLDVVG